MKKVFFLTFYVFSLFSKAVWGIDFEDGVFPELATSARALAMGNAFICKVDNSSAVFYNPAGLGTARGAQFHLSNFHLESNKGWLGLGTTGKFTDVFSNLPKGFSLDGTRELLLDKSPGIIAHNRFHLMPNFTMRYFSAGFLYATKTRSTLTPDGETFEYADRLDYGPYGAFNVSLLGGILKFGLSSIFLNRKEANGSQEANTSINLEESDSKNGVAFMTTGGLRLTLPVYLLPTFALNHHNLFRRSFSKKIGSGGAPEKIKSSMDIGLSITPQISKTMRLHLEINYKDFSAAYKNLTTARRMSLGMEIDFLRTTFFRLGYGDGFGSAGLGIKTKKVEFDITTYAVDTSSSSFRGSEDRRFVISLSSGL